MPRLCSANLAYPPQTLQAVSTTYSQYWAVVYGPDGALYKYPVSDITFCTASGKGEGRGNECCNLLNCGGCWNLWTRPCPA